MLVALAILATPAQLGHAQQPRLYYGGSDIRQMNIDTSEEGPLADIRGDVGDLKADSSRVYWSDGALDRIGAVSRDGKQVDPSLINLRPPGTTGISPSALAVQGEYIYFAWAPRQLGMPGLMKYPGGAIGRATRDGTSIQLNFITPSQPAAISSLAVDGSRVYWADGDKGSIGRARLNGTDVQPDFITNLPIAGRELQVAAGAGHVYWSYPGVEQNFDDGRSIRYSSGIGRAKVDGSDVRQPFRRVFRAGGSMAISREHLFWGAETSGIIGRMNLDGSDVFACFYRCTGRGVDHIVAVSPAAPAKSSGRCSVAKRSVVRNRTLVASCRGVSGRVTITVASTLGPLSSAAGLLNPQQRFSQTVRRGRLTISTEKFCRDQSLTDRYRILFTRAGYRNIGAATVRVRSPQSKQRCKNSSALDD